MCLPFREGWILLKRFSKIQQRFLPSWIFSRALVTSIESWYTVTSCKCDPQALFVVCPKKITPRIARSTISSILALKQTLQKVQLLVACLKESQKVIASSLLNSIVQRSVVGNFSTLHPLVCSKMSLNERLRRSMRQSVRGTPPRSSIRHSLAPQSQNPLNE